MNNIINRLNQLISEIPPKISAIPETALSEKPHAGKWSKKEIIGHLCDSAFNNHSRFIRAQFEPEPFKIIPYMQDEWVKLNNYQGMQSAEVLNLWVTLNRQVINVISYIPEAKLGAVCDLGTAAFREGEVEKSLLWLIEDYVVHMEYHLRQVVNEDWLRNEYGRTK
jgi:hypothetical protein